MRDPGQAERAMRDPGQVAHGLGRERHGLGSSLFLAWVLSFSSFFFFFSSGFFFDLSCVHHVEKYATSEMIRP